MTCRVGGWVQLRWRSRCCRCGRILKNERWELAMYSTQYNGMVWQRQYKTILYSMLGTCVQRMMCTVVEVVEYILGKSGPMTKRSSAGRNRNIFATFLILGKRVKNKCFIPSQSAQGRSRFCPLEMG